MIHLNISTHRQHSIAPKNFLLESLKSGIRTFRHHVSVPIWFVKSIRLFPDEILLKIVDQLCICVCQLLKCEYLCAEPMKSETQRGNVSFVLPTKKNIVKWMEGIDWARIFNCDNKVKPQQRRFFGTDYNEWLRYYEFQI